jgi:hypothetical protein
MACSCKWVEEARCQQPCLQKQLWCWRAAMLAATTCVAVLQLSYVAAEPVCRLVQVL